MTALLDSGRLPVEELATLALREARRPNPVYGAHRWFARRQGSAMRALLVASNTSDVEQFWRDFEGEGDLRGKTLVDPFMGGGTSLVEGSRLGARVRGSDVDSVACAVTSFQLAAAGTPDLEPAMAALRASMGEKLAPLYETTGSDGEPRTVVHWFWVQVVACRDCRATAEAHPHHRLASDANAKVQTVFCPDCHAIQELPLSDTEAACPSCARTFSIRDGAVTHGTFACPSCGARERLIDVAARTGTPPDWRIFASESIPAGAGRRGATLAHRLFLPASPEDQDRYAQAQRLLAGRRDGDAHRAVPADAIPAGEASADDRLARYGYTRYADLFNDRQLLHLSLLAEAIAGRPEAERTALALAFSDHLTTNCMLTAYAFGWRRLSPLFALRGFRHIVRPVEVNPWLDGIGRGTFPNAVRAVSRAAVEARAPRVLLRGGGFAALPDRGRETGIVECRDSRSLPGIGTGSVDLVLTDPPYLDFIAYHELADFYRPWLRDLGVVPQSAGTAASLAVSAGEDAPAAFESGLKDVFAEAARVLKPGGRLVFTFRHSTDRVYDALGAALRAAGLRAVSVFPLKGDGGFGLHAHDGSTSWDGVFVLAQGALAPASGGEEWLPFAQEHVRYWTARIADAGLHFGEADVASFRRATAMAARLGVFAPEGTAGGAGDDDQVRQAGAEPLPGDRRRPAVAAVAPHRG